MEKKDKKTEFEASNLNLSDLFAEDFKEDISPEEFFVTTEGLDLGQEERQEKSEKRKKSVVTVTFFLFLLVNTVLLAGAGVWVYFNLPSLLAKLQTPANPEVTTGTAEPGVAQIQPPKKETAEIEPVVKTEYEGPVSLASAEELFTKQNYSQAFYIYEKLDENLTTNIPSDKLLSDYLHLKMALSLDKYKGDIESKKYFEVATSSSSPFVKALANYHLAFKQIKSGKYLQARQSAYQTLGLIECFREFIDTEFEADCYFIVCESLTREVLAINNRSTELPADGWTSGIEFHNFVPKQQEQLREILAAGMEEISQGSIIPKVFSTEHTHIGTRYSAIAKNAPIEEILEKTASTAGQNIDWMETSKNQTSVPVTIYSSNITAELIAENTAGAAGLIARFDIPTIKIFNPESYNSLDLQKELLTQEAISVWRRFSMRYRNDERVANASYCGAVMLDCIGLADSAINHYNRTASHYVHSSVAPYALLNSAKLRIQLMDYSGAEQDLTQLVMQYRQSDIANEAYLELARASMSSGHYGQAVKSFVRLYNTDISEHVRAKAALGAGQCYFELKDFEQANQWLTNCVKYDGSVDIDYTPVYLLLGKSKIETREFDQASAALKNSLKGNLPNEESVNILIELAVVHTRQGNYISAMDTIESVDVENLPQELMVETVIAKSYILRSSELASSSIPSLRNYLAFISDLKLRSKMSFELAKCYYDSLDYKSACDELMNALNEPASMEQANDISLYLGKVYIKLGSYQDCIDICNNLLEMENRSDIRKEVFKLLGDSYSKLEDYKMAALAYAGKLNEKGQPAI